MASFILVILSVLDVSISPLGRFAFAILGFLIGVRDTTSVALRMFEFKWVELITN